MLSKDVAVDLLAGTFGGAAGVVAGHPFDTVKTRLQVMPAGHYRNGVHVVTRALRDEGALSLYKGMSAPLLTIGVMNAVVFASNGFARRQLEARHGVVGERGRLSDADVFAAGVFCGLAQTLVACPVELVKTQLQLQTSAGGRAYTGNIDFFRSTLRTRGIAGAYFGMAPTLYRDVYSFGVWFLAYEHARDSIIAARNRLRRDGSPTRAAAAGAAAEANGDMAPVCTALAGAVAGVCSWASVYPIDIIKSRVQGQDMRLPRAQLFASTAACARALWRDEGARGFARGLWPTLARAVPTNAALFVGYEWASSFLHENWAWT